MAHTPITFQCELYSKEVKDGCVQLSYYMLKNGKKIDNKICVPQEVYDETIESVFHIGKNLTLTYKVPANESKLRIIFEKV